MKFSTLSTLLGAHAKAATIAVVAAGATAGGGLAVATTVADSHAAPALTTVQSSVNGNSDAPDSNTQAPETDQSSSPADATGTDLAAGLVTPSVTCPSGLANHGAYVSSVAKTKPTPGSSPGAHGAAVSAAAQSDCGKPTPQPSSTESSDDQGGPTAHPSHPAHPSHAAVTPSHKGGQSSAHPNQGH
jgi:hypothetical protein